MLYLYTIMMFAWDLDSDTHSHFRRYLNTFINKRKISKDLREFVINARSRAITRHHRPDINLPSNNFNELRVGLSYRVVVQQRACSQPRTIIRSYDHAPRVIEKIHPQKYYHGERKLRAPSRPHTNP